MLEKFQSLVDAIGLEPPSNDTSLFSEELKKRKQNRTQSAEDSQTAEDSQLVVSSVTGHRSPVATTSRSQFVRV
eukprot:SAG31_NODE_18870_length_619_cov_2.321154_1_plen_73_part_01